LGGVLDRKLLKPELTENGLIVESEDDENVLNINFDSTFYAKVYQSEVDVVVPWIKQGSLVVKPEQQLVVMIRARSDSEIQKYFLSDLEELKQLIAKLKADNISSLVFLLIPRDYENIPPAQKEQMEELLNQQGAFLMVSPDTIASLNKEAIRRLETGRMVRQ
jgi:hypothetical protein